MDATTLRTCLDALAHADACLAVDGDSLHRARLALVIDYLRLDYGLSILPPDDLIETELVGVR